MYAYTITHTLFLYNHTHLYLYLYLPAPFSSSHNTSLLLAPPTHAPHSKACQGQTSVSVIFLPRGGYTERAGRTLWLYLPPARAALEDPLAQPSLSIPYLVRPSHPPCIPLQFGPAPAAGCRRAARFEARVCGTHGLVKNTQKQQDHTMPLTLQRGRGAVLQRRASLSARSSQLCPGKGAKAGSTLKNASRRRRRRRRRRRPPRPRSRPRARRAAAGGPCVAEARLRFWSGVSVYLQE